MLKRFKPYMLGRFFWTANTLFWLAVNSLMALFKATPGVMPGDLQNWVVLWWHTLPWFFNWMWMTAIIFTLVKFFDLKGYSARRTVVLQVPIAAVLLVFYWIVSLAIRGWQMDRSFEVSYSIFLNIFTNTVHIDPLIYASVLCCALAMRYYQRSHQQQLELQKMHVSLATEQLKALRSQLNPHFLFNALNTVASLVRLNRQKEAVKALTDISQMLRKILENKNNMDITIYDEIEFINSYLSIQKLRFNDKLETTINVDPDCLDIEIPNMLLHPMVENAIQHGSQSESSNNPLKLTISRKDGSLYITLVNRVAKVDLHQGFGIGISNTRDRLSRIYSHFTLEFKPLEGELYETRMVIPIGEANA